MSAAMHFATALDALPAPPCARLLGWRILAVKPKDGWIKIGFDARWEFTNPAGYIQGGFLAAMLDDTMGPAVFAMTEGRLYSPPLEMEGRVIQLGKSVAFLEGSLTDTAGKLIARATASARLIEAETALG
jgi:acyl-coenzyme A thioesterase PaaI-like protein